MTTSSAASPLDPVATAPQRGLDRPRRSLRHAIEVLAMSSLPDRWQHIRARARIPAVRRERVVDAVERATLGTAMAAAAMALEWRMASMRSKPSDQEPGGAG